MDILILFLFIFYFFGFCVMLLKLRPPFPKEGGLFRGRWRVKRALVKTLTHVIVLRFTIFK